MNNFYLVLDNEKLTQYFEAPNVFEFRLKKFFPSLKSISLANWIKQDENIISLKVLVEETDYVSLIEQYASYTPDKNLSQLLLEAIQWNTDETLTEWFSLFTKDEFFLKSNYDTFQWVSIYHKSEAACA